jgi:hypothetical protein
LYLDKTSRGVDFSVTLASMSTRLIPSRRSFIFKIVLFLLSLLSHFFRERISYACHTITFISYIIDNVNFLSLFDWPSLKRFRTTYLSSGPSRFSHYFACFYWPPSLHVFLSSLSRK